MNMTELEVTMAESLASEMLLFAPTKDFLQSAILHEINKHSTDYHNAVKAYWHKRYDESYGQALKELNEERRNLREKIKEDLLEDILSVLKGEESNVR